MSSPFSTIVNSVGTLNAGHIVLASEWNSAVGGVYSYINNTLLTGGLNVVTTKGDFYVLDGAALQRFPVGADGTIIVADSAQTLGVRWGSIANLTTLTTKGDLCGFSTVNARVPVGADGTFLQADSTQTVGVKWGAAPAVPLGGIILWDLSQRAMPAGYVLCDGQTSNGFVTPNMQGLYLVGAGLSNNPPAASGMGVVASGTIGGDTSAGTGKGPQHHHSLPGLFAAAVGSGSNAIAGYTSTNANTGSTTITPRYGALAFIMRTS